MHTLTHSSTHTYTRAHTMGAPLRVPGISESMSFTLFVNHSTRFYVSDRMRRICLCCVSVDWLLLWLVLVIVVNFFFLCKWFHWTADQRHCFFFRWTHSSHSKIYLFWLAVVCSCIYFVLFCFRAANRSIFLGEKKCNRQKYVENWEEKRRRNQN